MNQQTYESFFVNFANKTKFHIIVCLQKKEMNVGEISKCIDEEQSKVSHNLQKMAACNIVDVKKNGKERIYSLNKKTVMPILKIVQKHVIENCDCVYCINKCPVKIKNAV